MANPDLSLLTLNAREAEALSESVFEQVFKNPVLNQFHSVWEGVDMQQQIVFAGLYPNLGIKAGADCARVTSGQELQFTEKFWDPKAVEDYVQICVKEFPALWKQFERNSYRLDFDLGGDATDGNVTIEGISDDKSDVYKFMISRLGTALSDSVFRIAWHGDTAVAAAGAGTAGTIGAGLVPFYDMIDGIWKEVFDLAGAVQKVTITENSATDITSQLAVTPDAAYAYIRSVVDAADRRLRSNPDAMILLDHNMFTKLRDYYISKGIGPGTTDLVNLKSGVLDGVAEDVDMLMFDRYPVFDMENVWDRFLQTDFVNNTTDNAYWLPNRIMFTVPGNIPVATLQSGNLSELESYYRKHERDNIQAFGYTIDAKVLESYMMAVGY